MSRGKVQGVRGVLVVALARASKKICWRSDLLVGDWGVGENYVIFYKNLPNVIALAINIMKLLWLLPT